MKKEFRICPKCDCKYDTPPALSRDDNKTEICSRCGAMEAIDQFIKNTQKK